MGYAQWILLNIINNLHNQNIQIKDAQLSYGKFHAVGDKDTEIPSETISNMQILAGHTARVASSGRRDTPTGTTGSIDLSHDGTKICTVYWDCPWGSQQNTLKIQDQNSVSGYLCKLGKWNEYGGPIGDVGVKVSNKNKALNIDLNVEVGK